MVQSLIYTFVSGYSHVPTDAFIKYILPLQADPLTCKTQFVLVFDLHCLLEMHLLLEYHYNQDILTVIAN